MKKHRNLPIILLLTMILSIIPLGSISQANSISPFSDVGNAHWGLQHIMKMELSGVITGYGNGEFRPDKKVSQLEAVIMAIRAMGLKEEATTVDTSQIENWGLDLPNGWNAEGYVALAVNQDLIDTDNFIPSAEASRAWVGQLVIRMMQAEDELQSAITTSFTDDSSIPSWAKSYVALAVEKDIITGVSNSYGGYRYDPLSSVTRVQLATMISRAAPYMGDVEGQLPTSKIALVVGQNISLQNEQDGRASLLLDSNVVVFDIDGTRIASSLLEKDDFIRYGTNDNGNIVYIEVLDPTIYQDVGATDKAISGSIVEHFKEDSLVMLRDENGKLTTLKYEATVQVTLNSSSISVDQLNVGDEVTVNLDNDNTVLSIKLTNQATESITKGKIYSLNLETNIITLESNGTYSSYTISEIVAVEYEGVRFPAIKDLRQGDEVELFIENEEVKRIRLLVPYQSETLTGKIINVTASTDIVTVRLSDGSLKAYEVSSSSSLTITGVSNPVVADLKVEDEITFNVENNVLTSLTVTNREVMNEIKGNVRSVDSQGMLITILDDSNQLRTFEIDEFVNLDLDVSHPIVADIEKDMIVTLKLDNNVVYEVTLNNTVEGTLVRIEENNSLITLDTSQGRVNHRLDSSVDVNIIDTRRPDLDDLEVDQHVLLTLQQGYVTDIDVKVEKLGTLTDVDSRYNDITVEYDKDDEEYDFLSSTVITVPDISKPTIKDLEEGATVKLSFLGDKLTQIEVVPPTYGTIKEVDTYRDNLVIQTLEGLNKIDLALDVTVYNENNSKMSLSNLTKDDYVKVVTLENEVIITRTKAINGEFVTLSSNKDKIYITESNGMYKNYLLSVDVRLWKGTSTYYLGDLKQDQDVTLYTLGTKVIGISVK